MPAALPPTLQHVTLWHNSHDLEAEPDTGAGVVQLFGLPDCAGLQSLVLHAQGVNSDMLLPRLPPTLTRLHLDNAMDPRHLARFPQLQALLVELACPGQAAGGSGAAVLPPTLTRLHLWGSCSPVLAAIPAMTQLQHLELCSLEDGDPWPATLPPSLTHVRLEGVTLWGDEPLALDLSGCTALEVLSASVRRISTGTVAHSPSIAGLVAPTRLRHLELHQIYAPDLGAAVPGLRALTSLCLEDCQLAPGIGEDPPEFDVEPLQGLRELQVQRSLNGLPETLTRLQLLTSLDFWSYSPIELSQPQLTWLQQMFGFQPTQPALETIHSYGMSVSFQ